MRQKVDSSQENEHIRSHAQSLGYTFNRFMVILARLILMGLIANLMIKAFLVAPVSGFRSIAAIVLPLLLVGYINFSNRPSHPHRSWNEVSNILTYVGAASWLLTVMVLIRYVIFYSNRSLPIGEFVLALTLGFFGYLAGRIPQRALFAFSYGLISGFLIFILVFGVPA
jgi:hypothetical protein